MRVFKITGHVIDSKTQQGVKGLRVEAWDKDLIISDLVGGTTTGEGGIFRIQFDASYFRELFLDQRPDLYFKVFRGDKLIKSTKDSVLWNVDQEDIEITIEVEDSGGANGPSDNASKKAATTRGILQATFTPRKPRPDELQLAPRAHKKAACLAMLMPQKDELEELKSHYMHELKRAPQKTEFEAALQVIKTIAQSITDRGLIHILNVGRELAGHPIDAVLNVASALHDLRCTTLKNAMAARTKILAAFKKSSLAVKPMVARPSWEADNMKVLLDWAVKNNVEPDSAIKTLVLGEALSLEFEKVSFDRFKAAADLKLFRQKNLIKVFENDLAGEPIGYLHLEKLNFTPAGVEQGELVYSVPLSPGEEVNIKHREWSRTSEEFERIVTDYMEEFSEEGVAEKLELSESISSETKRSNAFNMGVSVSADFGPVEISSELGYNSTDSASRSEQLTRNHSTDITHKASSRSKKEHKISFRVASAAETENETVQRIKNPFSDRATRVDYYQLIRKWQVALYRYGIRLTYDLAVPEPGQGLLSKVQEIFDLQRRLSVEFESTFSLSSTEITPENYQEKADAYDVAVVDDPPADKHVTISFSQEWENQHQQCFGDVPPVLLYTAEEEIPEGYEAKDTTFFFFTKRCAEYGEWGIFVRDLTRDAIIIEHNNKIDDGEEFYDWLNSQDYAGWIDPPNRGKVGVFIRVWRISSFAMSIHATCAPTTKTISAWQQRVWQAIRNGARAIYDERQRILRERISLLEAELGAQDALSLRQKEREEIMNGVLATLGFPPQDYPNDPRVIKFLHHAIEWENVLYFLYPYFWSDPDKQIDTVQRDIEQPYWEFKKYLDHPDPIHRAFLKSGYARVVLTIRPGFEDAFMSFVETGDMDGLPPAPYLEIGKEFKAYAKTNYPGIPPSNPIENFRSLLTPKQNKTWARMRLLIRLLEVFYETNHRYPITAENEGLETLKESFPMKDPWGSEYVYTCPGQHGNYDLASWGADGTQGGDGQNADITSWDGAACPKHFPEQVRAWEDIQLIMQLLEEHYRKLERYPTTQEGLRALKAFIPLLDAWENEFVYECPGNNGEYDLWSLGRDGVPGGEGDDADITSWAEATLIGQWFEYTPTGALDIAFDKEIPNT
jgi:hypothetical protein